MLFCGEQLGDGSPPSVDIAVDPLGGWNPKPSPDPPPPERIAPTMHGAHAACIAARRGGAAAAAAESGGG